MESQSMMIVVVAAIVMLVGVAVWAYMVRTRRAQLRERFGPEYEREVRAAGSPAKAEAILAERAHRVDRFKLHPLSPERADAFSKKWRGIQARFVDDPDEAVRQADALVTEVMQARGYPIEDFEKRAEDLSVDHPHVIENYRIARSLVIRRDRGEAGTEELRQAVVNYRALFDDLLEVADRVPNRRAS